MSISIILIVGISGLGIGWIMLSYKGPYKQIKFSEFPVDLNDLFRMDNLTQQNDMKQLLNESDGQYYFWITPYPQYFHECHYPATFKWYLYTDGVAPMHLTEDSYLEIEYFHDDSTIGIINGSEIQTNIRAKLHITPYISVHLDHVALNKS